MTLKRKVYQNKTETRVHNTVYLKFSFLNMLYHKRKISIKSIALIGHAMKEQKQWADWDAFLSSVY